MTATVLFFLLTIVRDVVVTVSMPEASPTDLFYKTTSSTITFPVGEGESQLVVMVEYAISTIVRMLLVLSGIETNPGPATMYLLDVDNILEMERVEIPLSLV